jgi:hypothetical protein
MLHEIENVRQPPNEGSRRWFSDSFFDLIVWYDPSGTLEGFQLCYDRGVKERALTWRRNMGYSHEKIDDGESITGRMKMTPILVPDGAFDAKGIASRFKDASPGIDPEIAGLVLEKIEALE